MFVDQLGHVLRRESGAPSESGQSAQAMLKLNLVGFSGRAPTTLERALRRMRDLIDLSLAEARLRASLEPQWEQVRVADVFDYVKGTFPARAACLRSRFRIREPTPARQP